MREKELKKWEKLEWIDKLKKALILLKKIELERKIEKRLMINKN